ncbi:Protein of unknown function [Dyella sp. OK004]|uniref:DUF3313 domain-containing protein n=1 Tax=Dyella sp. OK004 TaxID=1855292 RepID=UPI0008E233CD|nr:DUF3313 domain-containing protein [Dyella sp. OK004]SFS14448.1 Protein of unknown function [Dyella sp. OK004]
MKASTALRQMATAAICLALGACATTRPVNYTGLESSPELQPNPSDSSGRVPYAYTTEVDWHRYDKVIVEPVTIYRGPDNQFEKVSEQDKQDLADYMRTKFGEALSYRFSLVNRPDPRTLLVKLTLTGAKATKQFVGTVTKFDLAGGPYNVVQSIRGKEGAMSGSVSYAVEIYDASSHRLLNAYIAKQYPNAMNVKATFGALGASRTGIKKGAEDLMARLD